MARISLTNVTVAYPVIVSARQRSAFAAAAQALSFGRLRRAHHTDYVVALQGLSVKIEQGARVGLIGRNGSGKSTLLRTLAGIITPLSGLREVEGSLGCVLSLGSGMDSEKTGLENLRTLGRLFGYRGAKLEQSVQEAVAFTELGPFIHMPVRTYSTGMMARLCFAIATSQHSDIMLIDEVIATGDYHFIHKAVDRVKSMCAASGIVVVATHVYEIMAGFCDEAIWMDGGVIRARGPVDKVWTMYSDASKEG